MVGMMGTVGQISASDVGLEQEIKITGLIRADQQPSVTPPLIKGG